MRSLFSLSILHSFLFIPLLFIFLSCDDPTPVPKPLAYLRIDLPEKSYQTFDTASFPYSFEYPTYCNIKKVGKDEVSKYWIDIDFPNFDGAIYLTYKKAKNKLELLHHIDTSANFMTIHYSKSSGIIEKEYNNPNNRVFASIYHIKGSGVASPYQFWAVDSNKHFLRGVLYFNRLPNNDSIAPIIDFISDDIEHLINTLRWKEN